MNSKQNLIYTFYAKEIWSKSKQMNFFSQYFKAKKTQAKSLEILKSDVDNILNEYSKILEIKGLIQKFPCTKKDNCLYVQDQIFEFERQSFPPYRCVTDFLNETDHVTFFIFTIDKIVESTAKKLKEEGEFLSSHILSTLSLFLVEETITIVSQTTKAFSFGHSSCPSLKNQIPLFELLHVNDLLSVTLTESYMMSPIASVSGMMISNPDAEYFKI